MFGSETMTQIQNNKTVMSESHANAEKPRHGDAPARHLTFAQAAFLPVIPIAGTIGNTLLSVGMRQIGPISPSHWWLVFAAGKNLYVLVGVVLLIIFFGSYLLALSWADLTYVIPTTSLGYVLVPLVSRFYLKEHVSLERWGGIALICVGVAFVAGGPSRTSKPPEQEPPA
jgi:drug/metabolite transporter (DMT)-like permease